MIRANLVLNLQEDATAIEEFLAKKHKRGKKLEDKSFKEKSILHSNFFQFNFMN